jgi:hypothetical protein
MPNRIPEKYVFLQMSMVSIIKYLIDSFVGILCKTDKS